MEPEFCVGPHCWHEVSRYTERGQADDSLGDMVKTERCCNCAAHENVHFELTRPEGHGPFAPMIWKLSRAVAVR